MRQGGAEREGRYTYKKIDREVVTIGGGGRQDIAVDHREHERCGETRWRTNTHSKGCAEKEHGKTHAGTKTQSTRPKRTTHY
jgi:hypothetical protein